MKIGQKTSWSNPAPGAVIEVPAGESVELLFTCNNDQQKVVTFELEASGLGSWGEERTVHAVAPFDTSNLSFNISPKATAELGDYPFTVRLLCGGDLVEPLGERALVLRVTEGAPIPVEEPVAAPQPPISIADITPEKPKVERKPRAKKPVEEVPPVTVEPPVNVEPPATIEPPATFEPPVNIEPPAIEEPPPPPVDEPMPAIEPEPEPPAPEPDPVPVVEPEPEPFYTPDPEPIFAPEPTPESEPDPIPVDLASIEKEEPAPEPEPEPEPVYFHEPEPEIVYVEDPKPKPDPVPVARPEPKVVKVVDLHQTQAEAAWEEEDEEPALQIQADHVIANPKEGTSIYARPGEKVLVRFSIKNEQSGVRTYVIQEDRALPNDWIALVQDQVNITPGGTGDVSVMLTPPINAEPATYPFTVAYGILGQPLAPVYLQLCVQAAPAVKLKAKANTASVWVPFAKALDYQLTVESQGNADTAYRVSVKDPLAERDESGRPKGPDDLYETSTWRYLFDRELDTLTSPSANRAPTPEQHRLKLTRKGIWWFGWVEKHKMTVAARPVTDSANGGKGENMVELIGKRWRLFPLPGFIMIPLLLLLFIMIGSGAKDLRVTNALVGDDRIFYIAGAKPGESGLPVKLKWQAPVYAVLKGTKAENGPAAPLPMQRGAASDTVAIQDYGQAQKIIYEVGSKFSWANEKVTVRFVPVKTAGMLRIFDDTGADISGEVDATSTIGEDKVPMRTRDITITLPSAGTYHLNFQNKTGIGNVLGQNIVLWTLRAPAGMQIGNFLYRAPDNNMVINPGAKISATVSVSSSSEVPEDGSTWELLTTDQYYQHLRIHIKVAN